MTAVLQHCWMRRIDKGHVHTAATPPAAVRGKNIKCLLWGTFEVVKADFGILLACRRRTSACGASQVGGKPS
ncbi:MAG TPA: hypothetical protein VF913_18150 [Xanthobacteraceae bacterium]